jgi:hypothetical protein
MATIKNRDQVGKSVRSGTDMDRIMNETIERVTPKLRKYSTERIIALLPRLRATKHDNAARRATRRGIRMAAIRTIEARGIEYQEWMSGELPAVGTPEYREVPGL